jgi:hypothetical protein
MEITIPTEKTYENPYSPFINLLADFAMLMVRFPTPGGRAKPHPQPA